MVITPDVSDLSYALHNGIKYFELIAEPVKREILSSLYINAWGYNGSMPGPTIQVYPGDYVNIRVINKLPEPTSIHWHGLDVPNVMDGVPAVEPSPKIDPGKYFDYHFRITNSLGTHMYHTHFYTVKQEMMGLGGAFIILDSNLHKQYINRDYFIMLQEFHVNGLNMGEIKPGVYDIDHMNDDFNFFTMNGRCFPYTSPLKTKICENVRIRLGNVGHNAHPIHIHGHQFIVSTSDGNSIFVQNRLEKTTINVASGETYNVEFYANNPDIWPFHCHIPHHMSNNMQKRMGGMFTVIKYV
ncbi:multicopper oxidase family protein [Brassicibacter mesophilus]|uniref:multicopper oxidase family protein n=1 Tax=Brassicibacter mesophilus TaxID=745119 RepID=UPI003D195B07